TSPMPNGAGMPGRGGGYALPLPVGSSPDPHLRKQTILVGNSAAILLPSSSIPGASVLSVVLAIGTQSDFGSKTNSILAPAYTKLTCLMRLANSSGVTEYGFFAGLPLAFDALVNGMT